MLTTTLSRGELLEVLKFLLDEKDRVHHPAVVFDIDQTALLSEAQVAESGKVVQLMRPVRQDAVHSIYETALLLGYDVFFVTARNKESKEFTKQQLRSLGYERYTKLYLRRSGVQDFAYWKTSKRKHIEDKGYTIVLNVGDQATDLLGGHAIRTLKLRALPVYTK